MKTPHILLCLALSLLGAGLKAQNDLPQVFSPNAAELGKYGKIPVSYFNGLPNISIPLTELRAKGYTLPIYLTYHAGGNKPDQHPGWVGLGWTLHAGGCINRIVNGEIDEMGKYEQPSLGSNPFIYLKGYYYRADSVQNMTFDEDRMDSIANSNVYEDYDPDEFQVNFEGLSSSFFLVGKNKAQIRSKDAVNYTVKIDTATSKTVPIFDPSLQPTSITAQQYTYIKCITLTDSQGVVYVFGGDDSAIEFSYGLISRISPGQEWMRRPMKRTANTWHITTIRFPSGEEIHFDYLKSGVPLIVTDRHYTEYSSLYYSGNTVYTDGYLYSTQNESAGNINFTLISPSYLSRIRSIKEGDDIWFFSSPTNELAAEFEDVDLWNRLVYHASGLTLDAVHENNHYRKLHSILTESSRVDLFYTNSTQERLKLNSLVIKKGKYMDDDARYSFTYNSLKLPAYNSKQTDMWGYYSRNTERDETEKYYLTDEQSMQAEMLTSIQYPTGGSTYFEYEAHRYGKVAGQYPFTLVQESGQAGGLRIHRMTDVANGKTEVREFEYKDILGGSSGILAGKPIFRSEGATRFRSYGLRYDFLFWTISFPPGEPQEGEYVFDGEMPMNQMSLTDGSHVTYSRVAEIFADGSRIVHHYSNHESFPDKACVEMYSNYEGDDVDNPHTSWELSRGLLTRKEYRSALDGHPIVRLEENEYYLDTLQCLLAVKFSGHCRNTLRRKSFLKVFTYHPYQKRTIITTHPDNGALPHVDTVEYTYDSHRRLTETKRMVGSETERDTYTYTGDVQGAPYTEMVSRNMIALPVEQMRFRKDSLSEKVVSADLTTWKKEEGLYVPAAQWKAALGQGVTPVSFNAFDGEAKDSRYGSIPELSFTRYDAVGNLLLGEDRSGLPTTYFWTPDGCHPAAIFKGARNGTRETVTPVEIEGSVWSDLNILSGGTSIDLEFHCSRSGIVEVFLSFLKAYGRTVWWRMDFGTEHRWDWPSLGPDEELEVQTLFSGVLPAGNHMFQMTAMQGSYSELDDDEEEVGEAEEEDAGHGPMASETLHSPRSIPQTLPSWGFVNVSYPSVENQLNEVRADECLFESFGPEETGSQEGFDGGGTFTGVKTLDFSPYPDKTYVIDWQEWQPDGTWAYRSKTVPGTGTFTAGTAGKVMDHVRVFPQGTQVESYTWDAAGNLLSRTDSRGVTESYRYDGLGRLTGVYDNDGNKVEGYQYNYKNR
ncbi:MAG: RHS repeat protein [Bacteroidales bacterium]|nr:RHS repeat protein [Bacteroidales bacterium]